MLPVCGTSLRSQHATGVCGTSHKSHAILIATPQDLGRALRHWRGLIVIDECDDARHLMPALLSKLLSTQELRVLCTARNPLGVAGENVYPTVCTPTPCTFPSVLF